MQLRPPALILAVAAICAAQGLPPMKHVSPAPQQPIPFSHRTHVSNGLTCKQCHPMPEPGDFAEIVGTEQCMACHTAIKTESDAIQKLAAYHKKGEDVPWEPVYLVADYVFFNHSVHIGKAGAKCESCHGRVGARDALAKERDISMAACMDCHRAAGGSLDCAYCHDPR